MAIQSTATNNEEECASPTGSEPRSPGLQLKKLTRTLSLDTTSSTSMWHKGTTSLLQTTIHEEDPPAHYESKLCTVGFAMKLVEWTLCILCTGLFFEGSGLIYDFKKQLIPHIAYWSYMMITGVIIISYLLGQKMREMLIRMYNIIGAVMFLIAAIFIFEEVLSNWETWMDSPDNLYTARTLNTTAPKRKESSPVKKATMLLSQSVLCFINGIIYFADTTVSLYLSYKSVGYNVQQ